LQHQKPETKPASNKPASVQDKPTTTSQSSPKLETVPPSSSQPSTSSSSSTAQSASTSGSSVASTSIASSSTSSNATGASPLKEAEVEVELRTPGKGSRNRWSGSTPSAEASTSALIQFQSKLVQRLTAEMTNVVAQEVSNLTLQDVHFGKSETVKSLEKLVEEKDQRIKELEAEVEKLRELGKKQIQELAEIAADKIVTTELTLQKVQKKARKVRNKLAEQIDATLCIICYERKKNTGNLNVELQRVY
jgi:predicted transcriptional regulator